MCSIFPEPLNHNSPLEPAPLACRATSLGRRTGFLNSTSLSIVATGRGSPRAARVRAALGEHLPVANIDIEVEFKKPVRLPSEVALHASGAGSSGELWLKGSGDIEHMVGRWRPIG